jgi:hypothetical protein
MRGQHTPSRQKHSAGTPAIAAGTHNYCRTFTTVGLATAEAIEISQMSTAVRHVTGNDEDYLRKIPRVVVQKSALL